MATATPTVDAKPSKGKSKKLLIILAALLLVLAAAGGGTLFYLKKKQAAELEAELDENGEEVRSQAKAKGNKRDLTVKPVFVALDLFTVNLADRDADRYAQVTISLELTDEKSAEVIKNFMPVIRNSILLTLTYKTSAELLERDGKGKLAAELRREVSRALGLQVPDDPPPRPAAQRSEDADSPPPRRRVLKPEEITPVKAVHFSNFIIQ
jgi:flagellar FliL protein